MDKIDFIGFGQIPCRRCQSKETKIISKNIEKNAEYSNILEVHCNCCDLILTQICMQKKSDNILFRLYYRIRDFFIKEK